MSGPTPYRIFDVSVARRTQLSPHLCRLTFAGIDVCDMATFAPDQRIKIFFPHDDGRAANLPVTGEWYAAYKALPPAERAPMRTYTIRALRCDLGEVDVDFVLHGEIGPATRWATNAKPGDCVQIAAPNRPYREDSRGYEWRPPAGASQFLLAGDETALPALAGIIEQLNARSPKPRVEAYIEVPLAADRLDLRQWDGLDVTWLVRDDATPGALLARAVRQASVPDAIADTGEQLAEIDGDDDRIWDRAAETEQPFYAFVAGEAAAVREIRTFLVKESGIDRRALNLMAYWRHGQGES